MSFGSEDEIQSHVTSHLMNEGSRHECRLCSQIHFDSPLKLQAHLIEHTFEGCSSFTCYMCSTVFTTANGLQHHMLEHGLHTRPYDCTHCHLKFFFRAELENHIVSHEEIKRSIVERYVSGDFSKSLGFTDDSLSPFQLGKSLKSATNGHSSSKNKSTQNKRKKFFYRSDDSDEEMQESQSSSSLTPTPHNPDSYPRIKEERQDEERFDHRTYSDNEETRERRHNGKSTKARKQSKRRRQSEKRCSAEIKEEDPDLDGSMMEDDVEGREGISDNMTPQLLTNSSIEGARDRDSS